LIRKNSIYLKYDLNEMNVNALKFYFVIIYVLYLKMKKQVKRKLSNNKINKYRYITLNKHLWFLISHKIIQSTFVPQNYINK